MYFTVWILQYDKFLKKILQLSEKSNEMQENIQTYILTNGNEFLLYISEINILA
jgi:hypothetical protein